MKIVLTSALLLAASATGGLAQAIADNMTCQQATNYYEQNGRISKLAGNSAIPIYGGVPASRRNELSCSTVPIWLRTTDNRRCPVAFKCQPRSAGPGGP